MHTDNTLPRAERLRQASQHRRQQEKEANKQAILKAAAALFLEQGYDGFSLRQVAERLGHSATNIYYYFSNKDDLLFAIVDEAFLQFSQQLMAAAESTEDPLQRLRAIAQAYLHFGLHHPVPYQLMFMQRSDFLLAYRQGEHEPRIASFRVLKQAVRQAIDAGVVRFADALTTSTTLWAMSHGIVAMALHLPQAFDPEKIHRTAEMAIDIMLTGVQQENSSLQRRDASVVQQRKTQA